MADQEFLTIDTGLSSGIKKIKKSEPYKLVSEDEDILNKKTEIFNFGVRDDAVEISERLVETVKLHRAYGLAAPQCGLDERVFVMGAEDEYLTIFNPEIVSSSSENIHMDEGCLSFPFLVLAISRPKGINVKYQDQFGEYITKTFSGISARIFQHELDHLNGITFNKVAKPLALKMSNKKREKQIKRFARELLMQTKVKNENSN